MTTQNVLTIGLGPPLKLFDFTLPSSISDGRDLETSTILIFSF